MNGGDKMPFYEREEQILALLDEKEDTSVSVLSEKLFVSIPTLRRDLIKLEQRGKIIRTHGGAKLLKKSAYDRTPFYLREEEQPEEKRIMAKKAIEYVKSGDIVMLDGSTSAFAMVPLLAEIPNIIVITSSAKTSFLLGQLSVSNISTGGRMIAGSLSYVGADAEATIQRYNADVVFFSCAGINLNGYLTDISYEENYVRSAMLKQSKCKVCLCAGKKFGKTFLHNLCHLSELDAVISENDLPPEYQSLMKK